MLTQTSPESLVTTCPTVLFVDLDDTLVKTDLLAEALVKAVKQSPWQLLHASTSLLQGKAQFKAAVGRIATPDAALLPYRRDVIELLNRQHDAGVRLVLATASPRNWAEQIANHVGLFDDVLASDEHNNLKGERKLEAIREYATRTGHTSWAYIGDCSADLPIFEAADHSYLVTSSSKLELRATSATESRISVLRQPPASWKDVVKAMRPHQWVKNILVFVPLILAHAFTVHQTFAALAAWLCFSCVASGVYLMNDMLDVESDRRHPKKSRRPFAAAKLSLASGIPLVAGLLTIGFATAFATLPLKFVGLLGVYFVLTTLYSAYLKNKLILDVMVLAGLYTLRVIAGGAAVDVPVSEWLMAFSIFLFTSLAFAKRYAELSRMRNDFNAQWTITGVDGFEDSSLTRNQQYLESMKLHGRSYRIEDIGLIESLGPTSGYMSVLVLALYISSPQMATLYKHGWMIWYVCPMLMYWITRLWFVAKRGKLNEDPIVFALRDGVSLLTGGLVGIVMLIAIAF